MIISVMLTQTSYAQPIPGMSPKEKAALEEKKAQEKDADKTYKSTLGNIPDAKKTSIHGEIYERLPHLPRPKPNNTSKCGKAQRE